MRHYLTVLFAVAVLAIPWFAVSHPAEMQSALSFISDAGDQLAAVILSHNAKTIADIQGKYVAAESDRSGKKVRILIVPGHEPGFGGAEFGSIKERELTVELGKDLQGFLDANSHYKSFITRDEQSWSPAFDSYFKNNLNDIVAWAKASRAEMAKLISVGSVKQSPPTIMHNKAPDNVAYRLFGITKWANENDVDITVHIHFNDYPGHPGGVPGKYSGFAIYVPEGQYYNSTTTKAIASAVFKRLAKYNPVSDLPGESTGIVEEPDLIAIGTANTADSASMLIEYAYLYEPQLTDPSLRSAALKDMAYQTYLGLQDFFGQTGVVNTASAYDTLLMPHSWREPITKTSSNASDIYALQTALVADGDYPPSNKSLNDCPRSGSLGPCTLDALSAFQKKYSITGENGVVGPKTQAILNSRFGAQGII